MPASKSHIEVPLAAVFQDLLAQGWSEAEILGNYPGLSREVIQACLKYASEAVKAEKVYTFRPASD